MKIAGTTYIAALFLAAINIVNIKTVMAQPPIRDPHTPGYVTATELPDGAVPSPDSAGNFIIGPTHPPAPETEIQPNVPQGKIYQLTMRSEDSKIYPGIAREPKYVWYARP